MSKVLKANPQLASALQECRKAFLSVALFSGLVNLLVLTGPLYMLQVYDRVLASRSVPTLVALSVFLVVAYAFQGGLEVVRARLATRIATLLDSRLGVLGYDAVIRMANRHCGAAEAHQPLRDLDRIRAFLTGPGPIALIDLPWMPVFLAICFLIHPWLGAMALAGAGVLVGLTVLTERRSRAPTAVMTQNAGTRASFNELTRRNSETIAGMGMGPALSQRWRALNERHVTAVARNSDVASSYGSIARMLRLLLQSAMLGLGALLVIRQELSAGAMFAASIMMGRALAPIDTVIANWRSLTAARQALRQLSTALAKLPAGPRRTDLMRPANRLDVEHAVVAAPNGGPVIVANLHFALTAGEALAVVGPSGAGKTSLARSLIGIWPLARGEVRLDGAALDQWNEDARGRHIGYVGQTIEFFDGTIAENIARMSLIPDSAAVLVAGRAAGAHDMIIRLPGGYDCRIGDGGVALSAGQRQRIALARALYGDPFLVVLDEPNANLDTDGELALQHVIGQLKARGAIVVIISHRPAVLDQCTRVLVLGNGVQQALGPREAIMRPASISPQRSAVGGVAVLRDVRKAAEHDPEG